MEENNFESQSSEEEEALKEKLEQEEKAGSLKLKSEIISWIKVIVFAVVLAFVLANYVVMNAYIPSESMENTLKKGDRLIGFRLSYTFSEPERFDVVMFKWPDDESKDFIKRIIGLPGETVTLRNGKVYINGSNVALDEPYLKEEPNGMGDGTYVVPEGCYFMLGDNRNGSKDSRMWENKFVKKEKILAKAIFRFYPNFTILDRH